MAYIAPVSGTAVRGGSNAYGAARSSGRRAHSGIDISTGQYNIPVVAITGGTVAYVGVNQGYGGNVVVLNSNGTATRYAMHTSMDNIPVQVGDVITAGQELGIIGNLNNAPPHLHFEMITDPGIVAQIAKNADTNTFTSTRNQLGTSDPLTALGIPPGTQLTAGKAIVALSDSGNPQLAAMGAMGTPTTAQYVGNPFGVTGSPPGRMAALPGTSVSSIPGQPLSGQNLASAVYGGNQGQTAPMSLAANAPSIFSGNSMYAGSGNAMLSQAKAELAGQMGGPLPTAFTNVGRSNPTAQDTVPVYGNVGDVFGKTSVPGEIGIYGGGQRSMPESFGSQAGLGGLTGMEAGWGMTPNRAALSTLPFSEYGYHAPTPTQQGAIIGGQQGDTFSGTIGGDAYYGLPAVSMSLSVDAQMGAGNTLGQVNAAPQLTAPPTVAAQEYSGPQGVPGYVVPNAPGQKSSPYSSGQMQAFAAAAVSTLASAPTGKAASKAIGQMMSDLGVADAPTLASFIAAVAPAVANLPASQQQAIVTALKAAQADVATQLSNPTKAAFSKDAAKQQKALSLLVPAVQQVVANPGKFLAAYGPPDNSQYGYPGVGEAPAALAPSTVNAPPSGQYGYAGVGQPTSIAPQGPSSGQYGYAGAGQPSAPPPATFAGNMVGQGAFGGPQYGNQLAALQGAISAKASQAAAAGFTAPNLGLNGFGFSGPQFNAGLSAPSYSAATTAKAPAPLAVNASMGAGGSLGSANAVPVAQLSGNNLAAAMYSGNQGSPLFSPPTVQSNPAYAQAQQSLATANAMARAQAAAAEPGSTSYFGSIPLAVASKTASDIAALNAKVAAAQKVLADTPKTISIPSKKALSTPTKAAAPLAMAAPAYGPLPGYSSLAPNAQGVIGPGSRSYTVNPNGTVSYSTNGGRGAGTYSISGGIGGMPGSVGGAGVGYGMFGIGAPASAGWAYGGPTSNVGW